ncbi:hypothetical protein ACQPYK_23130 [Streptosporangium sp. CA-135522]|uniref:hypothetical protein n=1 Tax=Streptosporangium sp. CA-135522 TaxID=3240072 RepID=UPI003D8CFFCA
MTTGFSGINAERPDLTAYAGGRAQEGRQGRGWDAEYSRDVWRLRELGLQHSDLAHIRFDGISQPWLRELAKKWARWRLVTGLHPVTANLGTKVIARFSEFLTVTGVTRLDQVDRPLLERYLADLHAQYAGTARSAHHLSIGQLNTFFTAIRRHSWDASLSTTAVFFPEDYPKRAARLPRALSELVMAQLERPDNLDRWNNAEYRLITLILMRGGLRITDAIRLPGVEEPGDSRWR